jgi:succinate dehydrogenase/fumarate reductase flavoprotein subunit
VGGILLNHHGKRFVNELGRRDDVSRAMYRHCSTVEGAPSQADEGLSPDAQPKPAQAVAFIVLSQVSAAAFGPNLNFYWKVKKFFKQVVGVEQLAAEIGAPAEIVRGELALYTGAASSGR